eukprot:gene27481-33895_t
MRFLGLSLLHHLTNFMVSVHHVETLPKSLREIDAAGRQLCHLPWKKVEKEFAGRDANTPADRLQGRCFDSALVVALLSRSDGLGYGFETDRELPITFVEKMHGLEVDWALGAAISSMEPKMLPYLVGLSSTADGTKTQ